MLTRTVTSGGGGAEGVDPPPSKKLGPKLNVAVYCYS